MRLSKNQFYREGRYSYHSIGICRYCRGAHTDNFQEGDPPSDIPTETEGSCSPFKVSTAQEGEPMDQTLVIDSEQETTEPSESIGQELELPRLRVRFQDETSSEVRLHVRSRKKIFKIFS